MTRTLSLLLPLALLAACSRTPATTADAHGPYAGVPGLVTAAEPVPEVVRLDTLGLAGFDAWLDGVATAVVVGDWRRVATAMEPEAWAEQRALVEGAAGGDRSAQVLAETLGLDMGRMFGGSPASYARLDQIERLTIRTIAVQTPGIAGGEERYVVAGEADAGAGPSVPFQFSAVARGSGFAISVPMG